MKSFIIVACLLHAAIAAPQLISFKDGTVGVNFLGYHAQAGLGGQNSQGSLLGGLHASAGTPWGQNAAAGLGGNVNGRASGILYAGAQAIPDVGASAVLGGDTSNGGFGASDAYVPGKYKHSSRTHTLVTGKGHTKTNSAEKSEIEFYAPPATEGAIQKIRPPKKYRGNEASIRKTVEKRQYITSGSLDGQADAHQQGEVYGNGGNGGVVFSALQIPVGILQSLQQSLRGLP